MEMTEQERAILQTMGRLKKIHLWQLYPALSPGEGQLLCELLTNDGVTVSALAETLGVPMPAVSRMLRDLEADGLITRQILPQDRRSIIVTITPEGRAVCGEMQARFHLFFRELTAPVSPESFDQLISGMNNMLDRMEDLLQKQIMRNQITVTEDTE